MTWHFKDGDWNEYIDCVCGHPEHADADCPEQVRLADIGTLGACGCDDYVPSRFDATLMELLERAVTEWPQPVWQDENGEAVADGTQQELP